MSLKDKFEQLEERERKLLMVFGGVFGVMVLFLAPLAITMSVSSQRAENERVREIIEMIEDERLTLGRRQSDATKVERRYARKAPALASYLAQIADKVGVEIPETQDRSTVPHGKIFKERSSKIRLRKVGMLALSTFMEKVAQSGYAVRISKLNIRKRGTKADEFDAEMEISAFDREAPKKKPSTKGANRKGKSDGGQAEEEKEED